MLDDVKEPSDTPIFEQNDNSNNIKPALNAESKEMEEVKEMPDREK